MLVSPAVSGGGVVAIDRAAYDIATKLQGYRERGDAEIWFIHPYERTLTAWRRQPDGSYAEETYRGGVVPVDFPPRSSSSTSTLCSDG